MDMTIREIDNFARGADMTRRSDMATMLWAAWSGAAFNAYVYGGKRLPNIDNRLRKIIERSSTGDRRSEVADVIDRMNMIAQRAGMPAPRPRGRKAKGE